MFTSHTNTETKKTKTGTAMSHLQNLLRTIAHQLTYRALGSWRSQKEEEEDDLGTHI